MTHTKAAAWDSKYQLLCYIFLSLEVSFSHTLLLPYSALLLDSYYIS